MEQKIDEKSKALLTQAKERISFIYIEKARIEQSDYGVQIRQNDKVSELPITTISCLLLGPGTTITHRAIANIAAASCLICWMGSEQCVFYAFGEPATNKTKNLLKQCHYHESKVLHTEIIHKLYNWRYPDEKIKSLSLEELKGFEGLRMKECYSKNAELYNVDWVFRKYSDEFENVSAANQYITALNHLFYAIVKACILIMGFSPSIGFIHTGHIDSFVFDIADLFKEEYLIPLAFQLTHDLERFDRKQLLSNYRKCLVDNNLVNKIVNYLNELFDENVSLIDTELKIWTVANLDN